MSRRIFLFVPTLYAPPYNALILLLLSLADLMGFDPSTVVVLPLNSPGSILLLFIEAISISFCDPVIVRFSAEDGSAASRFDFEQHT